MEMILATLALLTALAAIVYARKLQQELQTANRRLDRYNRSLFDANDELRQLREEMTESISQLRVELLRSGGNLRFSPEMTVREARLLHPQADQVLAGFHLGGCTSCAVSPDDTLAKICRDARLDEDHLLGNLNQLVAAPDDARPGAPQLVKIPNVEVNF